MYYDDIFIGFQQHKVKYVVAGGVAVVLHGVMRLTGDLDLIVYLEPGNLDRFVQAVKALGYQPLIPVPLEDFGDSKKRK